MILQIDAGNTRLKWRCLQHESVVDRGEGLSSEGLASALQGLCWSSIKSVSASSVVNSKTKAELEALCDKHGLSEQLSIIESQPEMAGVKFAYKEYKRLGVDRCLAMVAAYKKYPDGVLVIDAGSALTADYVRAGGKHLGGYILPGFNLLKQSLLSGTAEVNVHNESEFDLSPGASTEECVDHGRYFLCASLLNGLIEQASAMDIRHVLITGGDGQLLCSLLVREIEYSRDLVLDGLSLVVASRISQDIEGNE